MNPLIDKVYYCSKMFSLLKSICYLQYNMVKRSKMKLTTSTHGTVTNEKARDYFFDNIRAVLIVFVVWGHLLTAAIEDYNVIKSIYFFIYFFHMPAMVFISGYFSKNLDKSREKAFETILLPYLILNIINYLFKIYIIGEDYFGFRFLKPTWGLWYLLTLFIWKFFLKDLIRIRFILPLSLLLGILSGFSKEFSSYLALGRMVNFLPFFLLGYYCRKEHIENIKRIPKIVSIAIVIANAVISAYAVHEDLFEENFLFLKSPYPEEAEVKFMLYRIVVYMVAIAMLIAVINLTSERKSKLFKIGSNTMTVYILHLFTVPILEKFALFKEQPYLFIGYTIIMTMIIVYVYSLPVVKRGYDYIMDKLVGILYRKKIQNPKEEKFM